MDYQALNALIQTHPSWPGVSDEALVTWVNDATAVSKDSPTLSPQVILDEILTEVAEWTALTDVERQTVLGILDVYSDGVPTAAGTPARTALVAILGTATKAALAAKIPTTVSRGEDAGVGSVHIGDIQNARAI